jgi:tetrahydromethanopterin S-methyltransferase subunit B
MEVLNKSLETYGPDYIDQLTEISKISSEIQKEVSSLKESKLPILMVDVDKTEELEQREARCADLESILEDREARVKSESNKNKVKNVAGKLYFVLGGIAIAGAAVYGEYTGITDFVDYSYLRG